MDAHLIDSEIYGHNWSTPESHSLFNERARVIRWVDVVKALAEAQADLEMIPKSSAAQIATIDPNDLDLAIIAERTRATSHSTLGLIQVLQDHLPEEARQHVYFGATVQDISDTAATLELMALANATWRDLWRLEGTLLDLAQTHRNTPMLGRTHGQPGAPISFGFKAAGWADEVGRSLVRLRSGRERWNVGQLAGAVGVLGFHGPAGVKLVHRFCTLLDLDAPQISWTSARDRLAEFASVAAIAASTLARIADEIYNLQREELGEVAEASSAATVGSITMPHKRNPETSEQVIVLARLVRSAAHVLTETMVGDHERDGRTWKTEWILLPQLGHHLLASLAMTNHLVEGLTVNETRMRSNLSRYGVADSQELLRRLSMRIGKHRAQGELNDLYRTARETGQPIDELLPSVATAEELAGLESPALGSAPEMVDAVVEAALNRRSQESDSAIAYP